MESRWINSPSPVWDKIKSYMEDDNGGLQTGGEFLGVFIEDKMAGAFLIKRWNVHCYEIHGGVHPDFWGKGVEICDHMGRTLFASTPCLKIVAIVPEFNKLMRKCLLKVGLKEEGVIRKGFLKRMRLHDLVVYGICKSDVQLERSTLCLQP